MCICPRPLILKITCFIVMMVAVVILSMLAGIYYLFGHVHLFKERNELLQNYSLGQRARNAHDQAEQTL